MAGRVGEVRQAMARDGVGLMPDLDEWQRWSERRRRITRAVREVKGRLRPTAAEESLLHRPAAEIHTLVVVDKVTPSCVQAVVEPLRHMDLSHTAVLTRGGAGADVPADVLTTEPFVGIESLGPNVRSVLSLGSYLELSAPIYQWARSQGMPFYLVQHGLLTPWSPPASSGARVLAWSAADAEYWTQGRPDVEVDVVGSQMLAGAAALDQVGLLDERPLMLGQLHGMELSRAQALQAYLGSCRGGAMQYRPHPNENDAVSRALHAFMRRRGVEFETSGASLPTLARPVVSIFSTGTLEAAMRGLPAYVAHPAPPPWLRSFWSRYGLAQWGEAPTPAWPVPETPPAAAIARIVEAA